MSENEIINSLKAEIQKCREGMMAYDKANSEKNQTIRKMRSEMEVLQASEEEAVHLYERWVKKAQAAEVEVERLREEKDLIFKRMEYATDEHAKLMVENADLKAEVAALREANGRYADAIASLTDNHGKLLAHIVRLRSALEEAKINLETTFRDAGQRRKKAIALCAEALAATPEQSLEAYKNEVLEEAAKVADQGCEYGGDYKAQAIEIDMRQGEREIVAKAIRALKGEG